MIESLVFIIDKLLMLCAGVVNPPLSSSHTIANSQRVISLISFFKTPQFFSAFFLLRLSFIDIIILLSTSNVEFFTALFAATTISAFTFLS